MFDAIWKRRFRFVGSLLLGLGLAAGAHPQETLKIGIVLPLTGPFASTGKQIEAGVRLYVSQFGDSVAGKKIELIVRDDNGVADATRRIAQELVVNDKVTVLAGFGTTPQGMAAAPVATQSKTPAVVMVAATSSVLDASPYFVRVSFTLPQVSIGIAEWAAKNGIKKVVTLVSDYGPGVDAETWFGNRFKANGGEIVSSLRVPLKSPDFAPFLQRVRDAKPDALFVFLPAGVGALLMKQFSERGLDKAGIRLMGTGDITEDDILKDIGDVALGVVTSHHYSASHDSPSNKRFTEAFGKMYGRRANYMAVHGYDGMHLIYAGLRDSKGAGGDALLAAMKGQRFDSPRGPVVIDALTRDVVQDVYLRKVERRDGELWNTEFEVMKAVRDPVRSK